MRDADAPVPPRPSPLGRLGLAVLAAAAFATSYWPTPLLRAWVRGLAGHPRYAGAWLVLEHALLYTTLCATLCLGLWVFLARGRWVGPPARLLSLGPRPRATVAWGVGAGVGLALLNVALLLLLHRMGLLTGRWELAFCLPDGWKVLGNVFSNFYEEFIYRGFLLVMARAVLRSTPLAVLTVSLVFGLTHEQYPLLLQLVLSWSGGVMAAVSLRSRSLWAAWLCHELYDVVMDSIWA